MNGISSSTQFKAASKKDVSSAEPAAGEMLMLPEVGASFIRSVAAEKVLSPALSVAESRIVYWLPGVSEARDTAA